MASLIDVEAAAARIVSRVRRTPVVEVEAGAFGLAHPVLLKLELLQHAGSFKPRGAFNRILTAMESGSLPEAGVIAASGGNHGLAVAHVARQLGIRAEVFVPEAASAVKVDGIRRLGAQVTVTGALYADAYDACARRAAESGALFVHAYDQPDVVAGQGTVGLELMDQVGGELDTVVVAVGGGGLAAGVTLALRQVLAAEVGVVAVEPELIPTLHNALHAGHPVDVPVSGVAADALGARRIGDIAFGILSKHEVASLLVSDAAIIEARQELWRGLRVAAEHSGATALAALTSGAYVPSAGERVAVIVCGGNTDPSDLALAR